MALRLNPVALTVQLKRFGGAAAQDIVSETGVSKADGKTQPIFERPMTCVLLTCVNVKSIVVYMLSHCS